MGTPGGGEPVFEMVEKALEVRALSTGCDRTLKNGEQVGCRHFDTAADYRALVSSLFITTTKKLTPPQRTRRRSAARSANLASLVRRSSSRQSCAPSILLPLFDRRSCPLSGKGKQADVEAASDASLAALGCEYVDLYLMHWPKANVDGTFLYFEMRACGTHVSPGKTL
jgi:aryl-alcohol dehydrogenase-like predicted oxidoreductase